MSLWYGMDLKLTSDQVSDNLKSADQHFQASLDVIPVTFPLIREQAKDSLDAAHKNRVQVMYK